jgi:tetratricopeptide (TPR) repeat protein
MVGFTEKLSEQHALGRANHHEFLRTGDLRSLDAAVTTLGDVVRRSRERGCETSAVHASLGWALMSRVALGDDVDAAYRCFERALQLAPGPTAERVNAVLGLAGSLTIRNAPGDLERSIELQESVLSVPVPGSYEAETLALGLSKALVEWYRKTRDARALDRAVGVLEQLADRASGNVVGFAKYLLATAYLYRYEELHALTDLMRAVRLLEEQLPLLEASAPERLEMGEMLMGAYNNADLVLGDNRYLERAIELGEQLLREAPEDTPRRMLKQRLGMVLMNRYAGEDAGRLAQAAELLKGSLVDSGDPTGLGMLVVAYLNRYWLTDNIADIENAYAAAVSMLRALRTSFGRLAPLEQLASDRDSWSLYNLATK